MNRSIHFAVLYCILRERGHKVSEGIMSGDICHYGIPRGRKTLFQNTRVSNYDDFRNCAKLYALLAIPGAEIPLKL